MIIFMRERRGEMGFFSIFKFYLLTKYLRNVSEAFEEAFHFIVIRHFCGGLK